MQAKHKYAKIMKLIYTDDAFSRLDEGDDGEFYKRERFVNHLDSVALATVEQLIGTLVVEKKPVVLDLMAGWDSHIPDSLEPEKVVGLGLNRRELERNRSLGERVIHDLNRDPCLPFADDSFDVVLNTVSVDYLTEPFVVFNEVRRVLKPGGLFLVVFSHRMFPRKATKIWREAGAEERLMMVEDFFQVADFTKPEVFVSQERPRPEGDKYARIAKVSDPVYAVYAEKPGGPKRLARPRPELHRSIRVDPETVERRKLRVGQTLRCPYCDERMTRWEIPDTPFVQWDNEYMYVCFNDECPYYLEGWEVMRAQGNPGFTYRLMYNPDRNSFGPAAQPAAWSMKDKVMIERG